MARQIIININEGRRRRPRLRWTIGPVSEQRIVAGPGVVTMFQMTDTQQAALSIKPVDKKGAPAQVQNARFSSSDESVVTIEQDASDPNKATMKAGLPGVAQVNVSADADMGDGDTEITGTLDVTVVAGAAASITVNAGAAEEQ